MAHYVELWSTNGLVLNLLDGTSYGFGRPTTGLSSPDVTDVLAPGWQLGYERLLAYNTKNRHITLPITIKGTTTDLWMAAYQDLERILRDAKNRTALAWLAVQFDGATYPLLFDVVYGDIIDAQNFDSIFALRKQTLARPVTLHLKPYGHPQALGYATSSAFFNGIGVFEQSAMTGERQSYARTQIACTSAFQRMLVARMSGDGVADFPFGFDCETGNTHPEYSVSRGMANHTGADVVDATAHNGDVSRVTAPGAQAGTVLYTWTILRNLQYYSGRRFHVWFRGRAATGTWSSITGTLKYGGSIGQTYTALKGTVTWGQATSYAEGLNYCGVLEIPELSAASASFLFSLTITSTSAGAATLDDDCVYLMPADEYYADLPPSAALSANDIVELGAVDGDAPLPFIMDSTGLLQHDGWASYMHAPVPTLPPDVPQRWFLLIGNGTAEAQDIFRQHSLGLSITMRVWWEDLFDLVR